MPKSQKIIGPITLCLTETGGLKLASERKKSMFGIGGCEEVKSSIFWAQRREKRERQMKGCVAEQIVSNWHMHVWILRVCDIVRDRWQITSIKNFVD